MNYRKLKKLIVSPKLFFVDAIKNRIREQGRSVATNTSCVKDKSGSGIPPWFNPSPGFELCQAINSNKPIYLYIPWIAEHGNALISKISKSDDYTIAPFDFVNGVSDNAIRLQAFRFARQNPALYRKMIARRLAPIKNDIKGVIFTFDWAPFMRIISHVCEELSIPRILIPHESVFVDKDKYYWDPKGGSSLPLADVILGWGELQKQIFIERGYPDDRFYTVGAPKFDPYFNYRPYLTREQFCNLMGLRNEKKIILFAAQPLDSQLEYKTAIESQKKAIIDLLEYTQDNGFQLIIRMPPSKDDILGQELRERIDNLHHAVIDDAVCYMTSPEETLYHVDVVTSVNSTMLFEGVLLGKPAVAMKYVSFDQIWEKVGIPAVTSRASLNFVMEEINAGNKLISQEGVEWAANMFGCGVFDGLASSRIVDFLNVFARRSNDNFSFHTTISRVFNAKRVDVVAIPSPDKALNTTQKYLPNLIMANKIISSWEANGRMENIYGAELFLQWGITESKNKSRQRKNATSISRQVLIIEDGFIRSIDIGLSGTPCLSIILDNKTAYYDATSISRLSSILQDGRYLTPTESVRARNAIEKIVCNKVSKYNHAPAYKLQIGTPGKKKILLVDQRFGDQSVISGLAEESSFDRMLRDAIERNPDADIIIKQHPDALNGGKESYFSDKKLAFTRYMDNVFLVNFEINPYAILELVDEVYVVTSGMGFEALMAGKKVHCYGMPFYAGWGVTEDKLSLPSRTRQRTVEDIFYFAYIESSRYFDPDKNSVVEVEDLVDYIIKHRGW